MGLRETTGLMVSKPGADNYSTGEGLILQFAPGDRELVWANSWDAEIVTSITIDGDNNIYTTGNTKSASMPILNTDPNYPVTTALNSNGRAFVNKFNSSGQPDFSFYLAQGGGIGSSIVIDNNNVLNVGGHWGSSNAGLPLIGGFPYFTPNRDFVVKINADGIVPQLTHSTFYRGRYHNFEWSSPEFSFQKMRLRMDVDYSGNLFLFGCTNDNIPTIQQPVTQPPGFYVKSNLTSIPINPINYNDNYIAAFDSNLNLKWSTYHGSNLEEFSGGIAYSDNQQRIVVVGSGWSGGVGEHVYDPLTFNPWEYSTDPSSTDYYQEAITSINTMNGFGAIFGVNELDAPVNAYNRTYENSNIKLWPNPTINFLNIESKFELNHIEFYDVSGRLVKSKPTQGRANIINTDNLSKGVYIIKCYSNENVESFKFMKL